MSDQDAVRIALDIYDEATCPSPQPVWPQNLIVAPPGSQDQTGVGPGGSEESNAREEPLEPSELRELETVMMAIDLDDAGRIEPRGVAAVLPPIHNRPRIDDHIVDGHMHIMSGFCSPLRVQVAVLMGRTIGFFVGKALSLAVFLGKGSNIGRFTAVTAKPTRWIALETMIRMRGHVLRPRNAQLATLFAFPMDLELGHIHGPYGVTAYERVELTMADRASLVVARLLLDGLMCVVALPRFARLVASLGRNAIGSTGLSGPGKPYEFGGAVVSDVVGGGTDIDVHKHHWLAVVIEQVVRSADIAATCFSTRELAPSPVLTFSGLAAGASFTAICKAFRPKGGFNDCLYKYRSPDDWSDTGTKTHLLTSKMSSDYEPWWEQVEAYQACAARYPWQIMPVYHYDPRRYITDFAKPFYWLVHASSDRGRLELEAAVRSTRDGTGGPPPPDGRGSFVSMKMYPPMGYRPCDWERLPHLADYYDVCQAMDIPITSHCNPTGFVIHERAMFMDFEEGAHQTEKIRAVAESLGIPSPDWMGKALSAESSNMLSAGRTFDDYRNIQTGKRLTTFIRKKQAGRFFSDEYISPEGWAKVLTKYPDLRLCLAHFGGYEHPSRIVLAPLELDVLRAELVDVQSRLQALRETPDTLGPEFDGQQTGWYEERERAIAAEIEDVEFMLTGNAEHQRPSKRDGKMPPPPNSGWEFSITLDLKEHYSHELGLTDEQVDFWMKFPLWNRHIIALICTHKNVYTDLSYFFYCGREYNRLCAEEKDEATYDKYCDAVSEAFCLCAKLRRRVFFGTDWYMVLRDVFGIAEYYRDWDSFVYRIVDRVDAAQSESEPHFRTLLGVINPYRFYRIADIRKDYTSFLIDKLGARKDKAEEYDRFIEQKCSQIRRIDPEYEGIEPDNTSADGSQDPCAQCNYRIDGECHLVTLMGFNQDGTYKYPTGDSASKPHTEMAAVRSDDHVRA